MKDKKLEEQFNNYFDGVKVPENLHADAKKYADKPSKNSALTKFVKIASVAASFVLCFAVALALILRTDNLPAAPDGSGAPNDWIDAPDATGPSSPEVSDKTYYGTNDLLFTSADPYTVSGGNSSLKFIENLAFSPNASVTAQTADFSNGETAFVYAEVSLINGVRDETKIFVEFTDGVYAELKDYYKGEKIEYGGITFYLTNEVDEYGEPVSKVYTQKDGVKYYFAVTSSDPQSYIKYLQLIFK